MCCDVIAATLPSVHVFHPAFISVQNMWLICLLWHSAVWLHGFARVLAHENLLRVTRHSHLLVTSSLQDYIHPPIAILVIPKNFFMFLRTVTVLWCCWYTMWLHVHVCILLELVCYLGYWYILYVTLLYCCYLIQYKETPVLIAALNGHVGALNALIRAKADVNASTLVSLVFICYIIMPQRH